MDFYYIEVSPPCRSVMLTAKALGVTFNKKRLELFKGEHKTPEFLAINPQHTVPTLVDGDLSLWESRAICTYLISKYGKDDSLYPNDPKERALADRLLYFDMGILFKRFMEYFSPAVFGGGTPNLAALESTHEGLKWFNDYYLNGHDFCVGNKLTVADFVLIATVSSMIEVGVDMSKYPNIRAWVERCKSKMPGYETENEEGVKAFGELVKTKLNAA